MQQPITIFWFRRDLRLHDNAALHSALNSGFPVLCLFILDPVFTNAWESDDRRASLVYAWAKELDAELRNQGSALLLCKGDAVSIFKQLLEDWPVSAVFANREYEPAARKRDQQIAELLTQHDIRFHLHKDHVLFDTTEIMKDDGRPYTVFTPYSNKWLKSFTASPNQEFETPASAAFVQEGISPFPALDDLGFRYNPTQLPDPGDLQSATATYEDNHEFPAFSGTTRLGPYLRFGKVSIRHLAAHAQPKLLNELIWRDFFNMIVWHFPHTVHQSFRPAYDWVNWRNNEEEFQRWCEGTTGYPMVDAGMRELKATGWMHNRVRMLVASFLCKHLLIDWRWGEAWFAQHLLDYDQASNVGNWQWAAGSGVDAAPYFRIFNPMTQAQRFDPQGIYQRRWIPELNTAEYPPPIVAHQFARERCLQVYKEALTRRS